MGNSITIKLVPSKTDKIYKPQENYADLYLLMNKLHFHSINEAIQEDSTVSNLELIHHQAQEKINQIHKEESCLNILSDCLEKLVKSIKKASYSGNIFTPENKLINDFNNIVKESDLEIKPKLNIIDIEALKKDYDEILSLIEKNLNTINTRPFYDEIEA